MSFKIQENVLINYKNTQNISELFLPEEVISIGSFSIDNHTELKTIHIHRHISKIGYHSFYQCSNLEEILVEKQNLFFSDKDGVLYDKSQKTLLFCPDKRTSITIPSSVVSIDYSNAFSGCDNLEEIRLEKPNLNYTVLNGVLYEHDKKQLTKLVRCPVSVTSLQIPESVTELCNHAFENCVHLKEITLPDNITSVGAYAFRNCKQLKNIHFSKNLLSIKDSAFRECTALQEVILPNGVKSIIANSFSDCTSLKKIIIPESVTHTGYIVSGCRKLESITCHGITVTHQEVTQYAENSSLSSIASSFIWFIVQRDFKEKFIPSLKYDILYRLFIQNQNDQKLFSYIQENFTDIMKELISNNQIESCKNYIHSFHSLLNSQNIDELIRLAIESQKYEIQIMLTNYKYQHCQFIPKDWTL